MSDLVLHTVDKKVMIITLNRPDKKNALTHQMYQQLSEAIHTLNHSPEIAVGLFTGSGGAFTAGNDLNDFIHAKSTQDMQQVQTFLKALGHIQKPFIAAVDGPAVGIGATLLPHCDLVYASVHALFSFPFVNLGLCGEAGSSKLLPRLMGHHRASECLLLGETFGAKKAADIGLVNEVIEGNVIEYALQKAHTIAKKPLEALIATKRLLKEHADYDHDKIIEQENKVFFELLHSDSTKKIMSSFFEKT